MNNSDKLENCKIEIRSILIPYQKGCLLSEFNSSYREFIGRRMPSKEFGFRGDIEFLSSMPDVVKISLTRLGEYHLEAIADEKSRHIQKMVAKQKPAKSKASSRSSRAMRSCYSLPSRRSERIPRHIEPVSRQIRSPVTRFQPKEEPKLPPKIVPNEPKQLHKLISREEPKLPPKPSAKDEVVALVQYFDNEIALDDLLCAYQRMYQKDLSLSNYGFSSLEECIEDISELVIKHKNKCTFVAYQLESSDASDTNKSYNVQDTSKLSSNRKNHVDCSVKKSLEMPSTSEYSNNQNNDKANMPDSFREKLKMVAEKFTQGIWSSEFPSCFEQATGVDLDLHGLGYRCLSDLIDDVPDIFTRETVAGSKKDYIIYSVNESRPELNGTSFIYQVIVNLRSILQAYPEGIQIENFLHIYGINCRDTLHIKDFGFDNVETFLLSIKNQVPLIIDSSSGAKVIYMPQHNDNSSYTETPRKEAIPFDAANPEFKFKTQTLPTDFDYSKDYFSVYTSSVASPGHLYIQLEGKETTDAFGKLANTIETFYNNIKSELYTMKSTHIKVGASCVAKWPSDQHWYRAEIISVLNTETVTVHYVDYGTRDTIPNNLLRYIKKEFTDLPAQALRCRLAFLKPAKNAKKWDVQSKNYILKMCEDIPLMAKVEEIGTDGIFSIVLCDTNGEKDIYINDVLCDEGLADYTVSLSKNTPEASDPAVPVEYHHDLSPMQAFQALYYLQAFVTVAPSFSENENYKNLLKQVTMCCSNTNPRMQNVDMPHPKKFGPPGFNTVQPNMYACPNLDLLPYACHIPSLTSEASSDIKYKLNTPNFPVHVSSPYVTASTDIETSTSSKAVTISPDEFVDTESELFYDDDEDDEIFQQFCHKISSSKIQNVKRVMLGDGYKIHVIVIESKPYASSGDISHIIWNNKETDYLFRRLQLTDVDIQACNFCEDGNEDLFQQLEKFEVKGIEKKLGCKTSILLYPLKLVIKILNHFGHPSVSLRTKLTEEIANFNPNDPDWMNVSSPEPLDPEDEANASAVTDDDKIEKLCLFDLLAMKESITFRKKRMLISLGSNTKCDEIDKLEQLNQKVLQRIQEIKEICSVFS